MDKKECEEKLLAHQIRSTANRELVLRLIASAENAVSLSDIEIALETVDKSTIFRILTLFLDHHLLHAIEDGSGSVKYELCGGKFEHSVQDMHPHFYCEHCHKTFCMQSVHIPAVEVPRGYVVTSVNYVLKGVCGECARKLKSVPQAD